MRQTWTKSLYSLKTGLLALSRVTFGKPALAIVLVAILHNLLFLPLKIRNARQTRHNQQKLEKLRLEREAIEAKYQPEPGESLSPAQTAQKGNEIKELYQGEGVSFNIGCASLLLPSLSGLVLQSAVNAIKDDERFNEGGILWFSDLTKPDRFLILPLAFIGVATLRQRLIPIEMPEIEKASPTWGNRMQAFQKWLPLLSLIGILFTRKRPNAAFTLYQLTSSGVELAEDYFIKRRIIDQP